MSETLLSFSEVLLFGRKIEDLEIKSTGSDARVVSTDKLATLKGHPEIDGVQVESGNTVLVAGQADKKDNGLYTVKGATADWDGPTTVAQNGTVFVTSGNVFGGTTWQQTAGNQSGKQNFVRARSGRGKGLGLGNNNLLDAQLEGDACFARIYGFSYEGTYFELPHPALFLVQGDGESATDNNKPGNLASRAPRDPSFSGVAAADYQFADDIRVWSYDKADYTIRMDVETGMFEQVLLDIFFGNDMAVAGAKVSGAKVSGAKVSGAKVSGAKVSGAKVSGAKARGPGD